MIYGGPITNRIFWPVTKVSCFTDSGPSTEFNSRWVCSSYLLNMEPQWPSQYWGLPFFWEGDISRNLGIISDRFSMKTNANESESQAQPHLPFLFCGVEGDVFYLILLYERWRRNSEISEAWSLSVCGKGRSACGTIIMQWDGICLAYTSKSSFPYSTNQWTLWPFK